MPYSPHRYAVPLVRELPAPATAAARAARPARIWHICEAHPRVMDGPCVPGCRSFCGLHVPPGAAEEPIRGADPDLCVVCWELAEAQP